LRHEGGPPARRSAATDQQRLPNFSQRFLIWDNKAEKTMRMMKIPWHDYTLK
jgi:hypothetical protein